MNQDENEQLPSAFTGKLILTKDSEARAMDFELKTAVPLTQEKFDWVYATLRDALKEALKDIVFE